MKSNRGAAGVDEQSIERFEEDGAKNLYKRWNRLAAGSYFPPPVKRVELKKRGGGVRPLGIPTVSDRIAPTVVQAYLEPALEKHFHADSSGYRPGKSAWDAVGGGAHAMLASQLGGNSRPAGLLRHDFARPVDEGST